jgi:hypothetical protein
LLPNDFRLIAVRLLRRFVRFELLIIGAHIVAISRDNEYLVTFRRTVFLLRNKEPNTFMLIAKTIGSAPLLFMV